LGQQFVKLGVEPQLHEKLVVLEVCSHIAQLVALHDARHVRVAAFLPENQWLLL
jgi:hypothetical protein